MLRLALNSRMKASDYLEVYRFITELDFDLPQNDRDHSRIVIFKLLYPTHLEIKHCYILTGFQQIFAITLFEIRNHYNTVIIRSITFE